MPADPHERVEPILHAYGLDGVVQPVAIGWINETYLVVHPRSGVDAPERSIVQRLHPIFEARVHLDIAAVTQHLAARGVCTPLLRRTLDGALWVERDGVWRVLTFIEGEVRSVFGDASELEQAGAVVGRFHAAVRDLEHEFAFRRALVHDLGAHLNRLEAAHEAHRADASLAAVHDLSRVLLERGRALPPPAALPQRIVHGDLKASNLVLAAEGVERSALVDLDTLGKGDLGTELGDALRSWCNPFDESDPRACVDAARFEAALRGYASRSREWIEDSEVHALAPGIVRLATELASRFCVDAYEDRYFGWDPRRYASRREHNLARARGQWALAQSAEAQVSQLDEIARRVFRRSPH